MTVPELPPSISLRLVLGAVCLALTSMTGCGPAENAVGDSDPVRIVMLPFLTLAPFHIAAEEGYYAKHGLEVEFVRLNSIQGLTAALARGEVDASGGMLTSNLMNAIANGLRIRMIGTFGTLPADSCSTHSFVVRRELQESGALTDATQLRGLRLDADIVLPHGYWADTLLAPMGLSIEDLEVNNLPEPASAEALLRGTVDIAAVGEPYQSMALASGDAVLWRGAGELTPDYPVSVVLYGSTLLDERRDVGRRLAAALLEAARDFGAGKTPRNRAHIEEFTGLTAEQIDALCFPVVPHDGRIDASKFRAYQDWALAHGLADRILTDDELVDPRFMESATSTLTQ